MSEVIINHFRSLWKNYLMRVIPVTAPAPLEDLWLRAKNHQVVFNENDEASSSLRTHTPLHLGLCLKVSVSLSSMASRKFIGPVTFITFRKAPGILPVRRKTTKLLSSLMSRAASGFKAI